VPEEISFKTKPEIALEQLRWACESGLGSLLISGDMAVDEFAEFTGIPLPESRSYHTVAGFVLDAFGKLPAVGDSFDMYGWRFEVVDLDGRRVDKVLATKLPATRRVLP
jgi:magnesium and cobalt exporter, CNNM family